MDITIVQALLIALITGICYSGQLLGIYTNRSLVMAFLVGLVLGDLPTALYFGAIAELAYMGFGVGAGGTVPPNPLGPGIVGTLMAITLQEQGVTPEAALSLSFPVAVLFQFVTTGLYTLFAGNSKSATEAINDGNERKYKLIANSTFLGFLIVGFAIGLAAALSLPALEAFINIIPQWLINGFSVAGGLIPAMGFAMILSVMLEKELIPYLILGYFLVAYLQIPTLGVALFATIFALIHFNRKDDNTGGYSEDISLEGDYSDGI